MIARMRQYTGLLKRDAIAGIVVALVAVPLCLGIALSVGASPFSGMLSGIIGGLVIGFLSPSRVSVSGPAAGMIAVVLAAMADLGSFPTFLMALTLAGLLQCCFAMLKAGFVADYVPLNVIHGLLAAIGILIVIKQIPFAIGYFSDTNLMYAALKQAQNGLSRDTFQFLHNAVNETAMLLSCISLFILLLWPKLNWKYLQRIPASIVAVAIGILINLGLGRFFPLAALPSSHLVNVPELETFKAFLHNFIFPDFSALVNYKVYWYAIILALVASLETILNIEGIEKIDRTHRHSSKDQELLAQGVGNCVSGLLGGLPLTSVVVRSTVNIQAGAQSKISTLCHGFYLLIALLFFPVFLNQIPVAVLAMILIVVGYKLASPRIFAQSYRRGWGYFLPFIVTIIVILFTNLLMGVLIGLGVSFFFILRENSRAKFMTIKEQHPVDKITRILLPQQLSFLSKATMRHILDQFSPREKVILDAKSTVYIDDDIVQLIQDFNQYEAPEKGVQLNLEGFQAHYAIEDKTRFVNATTYDVQAALTPAMILQLLEEGNQRFVNNTLIHKNYRQQISATAEAQHPMLVVLGCIDSRVPIELIFDLSVGDAFVVRIAGNILNEDILGSIEFACHVAGAKLILVLGHVNCGAIRAACDQVCLGHLTQLLDKIQPAITLTEQTKHDKVDENAFAQQVMENNVNVVKSALLEKSSLLASLNDAGKIGVLGGVYDVTTGEVRFQPFFNPGFDA